MAKTLNQFLEGKTATTGYLKVKSPDEQKFVDKHVRVTTAEPAGNGDEVFKASKIKTIERKQGRKGYNPGEDEKVYEGLTGSQHKIDANKNGKVDAHDFHLLRKKKKVAEEAEELEELSTEKLVAYRKKAKAGDIPVRRGVGIDTSDEKIKKKTGVYNPNLLQRAKAKLRNEEAEELGELSQKMVRAYRDKARDDKENAEDDREFYKAQKDNTSAEDQKIRKRTAGIKMAGKKIHGGAKVRMGEEFIDLLATGEIVFANEEIRSISEREVTLIATVLNRLSEENQDQFCEVALKSLDGFDKMLSFAIQNKGE